MNDVVMAEEEFDAQRNHGDRLVESIESQPTIEVLVGDRHDLVTIEEMVADAQLVAQTLGRLAFGQVLESVECDVLPSDANHGRLGVPGPADQAADDAGCG